MFNLFFWRGDLPEQTGLNPKTYGQLKDEEKVVTYVSFLNKDLSISKLTLLWNIATQNFLSSFAAHWKPYCLPYIKIDTTGYHEYHYRAKFTVYVQ